MSDNTIRLKTGLAEMLKGGVIMDVTNAEQARIAEEAGAVAVMALERVPADIRAEGGVARMAAPRIIREIMATVRQRRRPHLALPRPRRLELVHRLRRLAAAGDLRVGAGRPPHLGRPALRSLPAPRLAAGIHDAPLARCPAADRDREGIEDGAGRGEGDGGRQAARGGRPQRGSRGSALRVRIRCG